MTKKERAIDIIQMLKHTISIMGKKETLHPEQEIFRSPRAKKSDLLNKIKNIQTRFKL
tara:strand:- start:7695 stop:7868 length:174 start_codon:yes stop_codon:yes gene_type:complete